MSQIKVRNLDDWIVDVHRDQATAEGVSLEQHLRELLKDSALASQRRFAEEQVAYRKEFSEQFGVLPSSTDGIRQDREATL